MTKYVPDYYRILGINTNADKKEIRQAYKKLSKKYNPENNKKNLKLYKLVNDAYIVLSDEDKRRKYDKLRRNILENKTSRKKTDIKKTIDTAGDVKDAYDLVSKIFSYGSGAMKGKGLMSGANIIMGGAIAGYGVKKGRDMMRQRNKKE